MRKLRNMIWDWKKRNINLIIALRQNNRFLRVLFLRYP